MKIVQRRNGLIQDRVVFKVMGQACSAICISHLLICVHSHNTSLFHLFPSLNHLSLFKKKLTLTHRKQCLLITCSPSNQGLRMVRISEIPCQNAQFENNRKTAQLIWFSLDNTLIQLRSKYASDEEIHLKTENSNLM